MLRKFLLTYAFLLNFTFIATATARAADDPDYLIEYRHYTDAYEKGDLSRAAVHGLAAWTKAEAALGDDRLTAILAYNYGRLVVFDNPEAALTALRRADDLLQAGIAELPAEELAVYLAYAEFTNGKKRRGEAYRLRKALEAYGDTGYENPDIAQIWLHLAAEDLKAERYRDASKAAAIAEDAYDVADPENYRRKAQAIIVNAVATLVPFPRKVGDVEYAHNNFVRAKQLFPPQEDIDNFDPVLATAVAWDRATWSVLRSLDRSDYPSHKRDEFDEATEYSNFFKQRYLNDEECGTIWARNKLRYPANELRKGHVGAVMAGYHVAPDGTIRSPRILAEVPHDMLGEIVLKWMDTWRATSVSENKSCLNNRIIQVTFIIKD